MKKGLIIVFSIILANILMIGTFYLHFQRQMTWTVREFTTNEEKADYACRALMPGIADILERYGRRGMRDSEDMLESRAFTSLDEMIESLPKGCEDAVRNTMKDAEPKQSKDITGKSVTMYGVMYQLPMAKREDLDKKYEYYFYGVHMSHYILEYEDGTYRFAVSIANM